MKLEDFFKIIPKLPGVRVFQFTDSFNIAKKLCDFSKSMGFELEIVTFDEELFERLKSLKDEGIKIRKIPENKEKYNLRSIAYDTIFVTLDIKSLSDIEEFLRKSYRIMKNGANIVLEVDKNDKNWIIDLLQKCNYVAINETTLDDSRLLFTAKKLHGWTRV